MGLAHSPSIVTNGLVLCLDAANPNSLLSAVEVLVVAGGGGGGGWGGGGGAGGVIYNNAFSIVPGTSHTVTIGAGGARGTNAYSGGGAGGSSSVFSLTAAGGGGGGWYNSNTGFSGGSGGGGGGGESNTTEFVSVAGAGTAGQGNAGGRGRGRPSGIYWGGGGGGGAGGPGQDAPSGGVGGAGGIGLPSSISGTLTYYGGGGGGNTPGQEASTSTAFALGGLGGGGNGGRYNYFTAKNADDGLPNTGGGGGSAQGGSVANTTIGAGGSGIVIVRYPGPQRATGGTVTSVGGNTIHTFTSSGTFTLNIEADVSNNGNNGTLVNGVGYSSANKGSLVFDGVDDYVSISQVGNTSSFSYEVFLKPTQVTKDQMYIGYSPIPANYVRITSSRAFLSVSAGGQRTLTHSETLVNNQIYHIVSIYNGVQLKIYVNNNLTVGAVINQTLAGWGTDRIGRWRDADQRSFVGNIYSLRIYNRELSAQEVQQNFNALRGRYGI